MPYLTYSDLLQPSPRTPIFFLLVVILEFYDYFQTLPTKSKPVGRVS